MIYGIWCKDDNKGWLRELPSNVDDGGIAILAFTSKREAEMRAAKHYGYNSYVLAHSDDWCEVRLLGQPTQHPESASARLERHGDRP